MSRHLSPIDIEHAEFSGRVRGFDKDEVREFLNRVATEVGEAAKERQGLERRLASALEEVDVLQAEAEQLKASVVAAESSGAEVKRQAEREARIILAEAETQRRRHLQEIDAAAQRERFELSRLKHQRALFMEQFRGMLEAYARSLEGLERSESSVSSSGVSAVHIPHITAAIKASERISERADRALLDDSVDPDH